MASNATRDLVELLEYTCGLSGNVARAVLLDIALAVQTGNVFDRVGGAYDCDDGYVNRAEVPLDGG